MYEKRLLLKNWFKRKIVNQQLPLSNPVSRTTTTVLKEVILACCVTATQSALSPEHVTERAASVSVNPASSDASVTAVTTPSPRFLLTAVKVRIQQITFKMLLCLIYNPGFIIARNILNHFPFLSSSSLSSPSCSISLSNLWQLPSGHRGWDLVAQD